MIEIRYKNKTMLDIDSKIYVGHIYSKKCDDHSIYSFS